MTSAAVILNEHAQTTLGGSNWALWHAMMKLAGSAAVGNSSGRPYSEIRTHFASVLGEDHPMYKRYVADFSAQLSEEAR